ncbi:MAG: T9SS type A sorting domain-containing protein, partial [Bacteroidales bacterium]|nr:T9SS type A sorting domain-containing protein [Bacteroidales bacterium]
SATVTWTPGATETEWELDYKLTSASTWTTVLVATNPTTNLSTLLPASDYDVRVRAKCDATTFSAYSPIVNFTTTNTPCDIPTNVLVPTATITDQSAVVTWTAAAGQTQWQVEYKLVSSSNWTTMAVSTSTTQPIQALQSNSTYEVRVKAICSATNESAFTTPVQFTTTGAVTYTITATATGPGTISPAGTVIVTAGADQTFTFTPTGTAQVVALLVDNQSTPYTNNEYTFPSVLANHTIAVDFAEGIDENSIANMVQLYPNPTNATIEIRLDETQLQVKECRVYDIYGKLMNIVPIHTDVTKIDVTDFAAGVYFIRMNSEMGVITKKFVKK